MANGFLEGLPVRERRRAIVALALFGGIGLTALIGIGVFSLHPPDGRRWHLLEALMLMTVGFVPGAYLLLKQGRELAVTRERLAIAMDERRRTDMALREAESRLRDVLEGAVFGIMIHRDMRPLFVNMAMVHSLRYESKEELMNIGSALNFIAPEERDRVRGYFSARIWGKSAPMTYETQAITKDGDRLFVELGVRAITWGGEPVVFITASDITERKHAEQALILSESRLSHAQSIAHLGNWEWRFEDDSLWWSDEVYRIFGLDRADGVPDYGAFLMLVHPEDRVTVDETVRAARKSNGVYGVDHRIVLPDGTVRHVHEQAELMYDVDGVAVSMVGTVHDITERKLTEQRLVESEARHRGFAADVAHELRTPLSVVRANLDNMGDDPALRSLREDIDSMGRLVEQLLAASRAEMLSIGDEDRADIHAVCVNVAAHLAPIAIQRGRTIEVTGHGGALMVRGHFESLEQAVRNLVENAIRYSDPGTAVTIHLAETPPSLSVVDRGRAIPENMREAIFSRFIRADQRGGGAGLGLAIVKRIVDAHGARIEVVGLPDGAGAQFTIRFPDAVDV